MICFVCLENANHTIAIFENDDGYSKIAATIEKHLCLKASKCAKK